VSEFSGVGVTELLPEAVRDWVQTDDGGFPVCISEPRFTAAGTPYLTQPGVCMVAKPQVHVQNIASFLDGFGEELNFSQYVEDPSALPPGASVCKMAGQLCYASFGVKRTMNADAERYFNNIKESGHGSVLEHANFTMLFYGISRSVTHELVRHRAGVGVSQISQRYVSGRVLRFVERPEYQGIPALHEAFERRIDAAAADYNAIADVLLAEQKAGSELLSADARTDLRKKVQQAARSVLPNETEAPIIVTANARAWRHILEMRASSHAEVEIRALAFRAYLCLAAVDPIIFGDYRVEELSDGTYGLQTGYPKV
jgi:thymidylate synthase (FAD)